MDFEKQNRKEQKQNDQQKQNNREQKQNNQENREQNQNRRYGSWTIKRPQMQPLHLGTFFRFVNSKGDFPSDRQEIKHHLFDRFLKNTLQRPFIGHKLGPIFLSPGGGCFLRDPVCFKVDNRQPVLLLDCRVHNALQQQRSASSKMENLNSRISSFAASIRLPIGEANSAVIASGETASACCSVRNS